MFTANARRGLCAACIHDSHCTLPRDLDWPPMECGEFELDVRAEAGPRASEGSPLEKPELTPYPGLCANCDHRRTCTYPKPEGGIWRCDEYV